jgi:hypothetical protein
LQFFHFLFEFTEDTRSGSRLTKIDGADFYCGSANQDVFQNIRKCPKPG